MELEKKEQDLVIFSHIQLHRRIPSLKNEYQILENKKVNYSKLKKENLERQHVKYFFADLKICRNMYFFIYNLGIKRYKNLIESYNKNGLTLREHKLTNKPSTNKNVISEVDIQNIVSFLKAYASQVAIPLPGRLPQFRNYEKVVKLPSCDTKAEVHRKFLQAVKDDENTQIVAYPTFFKIWQKYCPHIMTMKPATDLCDTCRENHLKLANLQKLTVDEQEEILKIVADHVQAAKGQREFYNSYRDKAKAESHSTLLVLSFDFAQNVSFPSSPQQVGASYFKSNRKCSLFGINNEGNGVQTNITIDEADLTGKGVNAVISMLHYYLTIHKTKQCHVALPTLESC